MNPSAPHEVELPYYTNQLTATEGDYGSIFSNNLIARLKATDAETRLLRPGATPFSFQSLMDAGAALSYLLPPPPDPALPSAPIDKGQTVLAATLASWFDQKFQDYFYRWYEVSRRDVANPKRFEGEAADTIVLFNVIVSMEWHPSDDELYELHGAFRAASDLLLDITNSKMAFGEVFIGDESWMELADIQIFASSRLHPRAGVRDLSPPDNALPIAPIRLGRGLWHRALGYPIAWDEAESYRAIIHEWMHYALGLEDLYVAKVEGTRTINNSANKIELLVPYLDPNRPNIMAHLIGVSELGEELFMEITSAPPFARLRPTPATPFRALVGPHRLSLPLPRVHLKFGDQPVVSYGLASATPGPASLEQLPTLNPDDLENTWLYLLKGDGSRLIAQGTLERRSIKLTHQALRDAQHLTPEEREALMIANSDFRVLGAVAPGDTLIAIAPRPADSDGPQTCVYQAKVESVASKQKGTVTKKVMALTGAGWDDITPDPDNPIVTVKPIQSNILEAPYGVTHTLEITIRGLTTNPATIAVTYYPLGRDSIEVQGAFDGADWQGKTRETVGDNLEGHLLVAWGDDNQQRKTIVTISPGGPGSGGNGGTNGRPAHAPGSSDGDLALLLWREEEVTPREDVVAQGEQAQPGDLVEEYLKRLKVLTTRNPNFSPQEGEPIYTIAATRPLLSQVGNVPLFATLVFYYKRPRPKGPGVRQSALLNVYNDNPNVNQLTNPLTVQYEDPVGCYIALNLDDRQSAPKLFAGDSQAYQTRWEP